MNIQLTPLQQQALDSTTDTPLCIVDPRTNTSYILVRATDYETIREILEDQRHQEAIHATALRNAAGRLIDNP